jgi:hypothetical protein
MSTQVVRAAQNSATYQQTGGTRNPQFEIDNDFGVFMDAIERQDTPMLTGPEAIKKGTAGTNSVERWAMDSVTPRGSVISGSLANNATAIPVPTGHSARFQQGHLLLLTKKSDNSTEVVWVNDDPGNDTLSVDRNIGNTGAITFADQDLITVIGIAMPELSDFPLAPTSGGKTFSNVYQSFEKQNTISKFADGTPTLENSAGKQLSKLMVQLGRDIKLDLDRSLIFSRKQGYNPDPAGPKPSTMAGLIQLAEASGNVYNIGGSDILISYEALSQVFNDLQYLVGDNAGTKWLMSYRTKQLLNSLTYPTRYNAGMTGNSVNNLWNSLTLDTGTIQFTAIHDFPDGMIVIYSDKNLEYKAKANMDWQEQDFATQGNYFKRGISGTFTLKAAAIPGMAIIRGFDTNQGHYPQWNRPVAIPVV